MFKWQRSIFFHEFQTFLITSSLYLDCSCIQDYIFTWYRHFKFGCHFFPSNLFDFYQGLHFTFGRSLKLPQPKLCLIFLHAEFKLLSFCRTDTVWTERRKKNTRLKTALGVRWPVKMGWLIHLSLLLQQKTYCSILFYF